MKFDLRTPAAVIATAAIALLFVVAPVSAIAADWTVPKQFATIQEAVDSSLVLAGDRILVSSGDHAGAQVLKAVEIRGLGQARIVSGPLHPSGLIYGFLIGAAVDGAGGDGVTISHLTFTVDLPVYSRGANDVTVTNNTVLNALQGITNWGGSRWDISHNTFTDLRTDNGGGIAIIVGDRLGRDVKDNVVAQNQIAGTLNVDPADLGGYQGTGIALYADFRFGQLGALSIANNRVVKNKVSLVSSNPSVVDVVAFEMTDARDIPSTDVIFDNAVGFNDFRGTTQQIVLTPPTLDTVNTISRNQGENRGQGVHPKFIK